ncbi:MAG: hypothetical protein Q4G25_16620, partial [Paracoccus sp. (in: a-proteobacteria)]|nr:hypothetical protein [Paracoccus sp. (in: a-proteobacteria)]
ASAFPDPTGLISSLLQTSDFLMGASPLTALCYGGPIAAAPYPLHAAGGGPHVADGRRIQEIIAIGQ